VPITSPDFPPVLCCPPSPSSSLRFYQQRVSLDLLRGLSLDDLHTELARHGSEVLRDRLLVDDYDAHHPLSLPLSLPSSSSSSSSSCSPPPVSPPSLSLLPAAVSRERAPLMEGAARSGGVRLSYGSGGGDCGSGSGGGDCGGHEGRARAPSQVESDDWLGGGHDEGHLLDCCLEHHHHLHPGGAGGSPICSHYLDQPGWQEEGGVELLGGLAQRPPPPKPPSPAVAHHHSTSFLGILRKISPAASAIFLTFLCTLSIFPSHTVLIQSQHKCQQSSSSSSSSRLHDDLFTPCLFLLFYLADFAGRALSGVTRLGITAETLWRPVCARFLLIPLLLLCRVQHSFLPLVFENDLWPALFVTLFALSNGFVSTLAMMLGPAMVSARKAPIAGSVMILSLNTGLLAGSVLSFLVLVVCTGNTL
jgi:hypothetical protein